MTATAIRVPITDLAGGMVYKTPEGQARWVRIHALGAPETSYGETIREAAVSYLNGKGAGAVFRVRLFERASQGGYEVRSDTATA